MKFILDMVHHNPGEAPFNTEFLSPQKLLDYKYNGQVFKHINTVITFEKLSREIFKEGSEEYKWIKESSKRIKEEIVKAKETGLKVYYHIDLFVLPKKIVELFKEEICYEGTDKICLDKEKTLEIHRIMFEELFERFPEVDGLIIRVGETYLNDTPYHCGNGPIIYQSDNSQAVEEKNSFIKLITFLKEEICVKHNRYLIFRTWDCFPNKFHADLDYYLGITNEIEPHDKLIFSIKHTALDFWRRVKFNPCLTEGKHGQVIEVQCQREYEGKGAYPNYVMDGVINGFEEYTVKKGIKDIIDNPLIKGIYGWSRGGGWFGPYLKKEFWCDINAYVLGAFAYNPSKSEGEIFYEYVSENLKLNKKDAEIFRRLCLLSAAAVLKGRYCEAYDKTLNQSIFPTANWMRDDVLGGFYQLNQVFEYLFEKQLFTEALYEKKQSVELWVEIKELANQINSGEESFSEFLKVSIEYGRLLYTIVYKGWIILSEGFIGVKTGIYDTEKILLIKKEYDDVWNQYRELGNSKYCASLYKGEYNWDLPGMNDSINEIIKTIGYIKI